MKLRPVVAAASMLFLLAVTAWPQASTDPDEGSQLSQDPVTGAHTFSWWGRPGRTYFLQQSDDLLNWTYLPVIESGAGQTIQWGFTSTAPQFFVRLKYLDIPIADPFNADFDGDGVSNWDELVQGTDPLSAPIDTNGLPVDWEIHYFGHTGVDPNADPDGDGQTNLQEFLAGSDPTKASPPVLTIMLGNGQTGGAGGYVPAALTVQLSTGGQPVKNGSVTFTVTQSAGQVQATTSSTPASTLTVTANPSGIARVFFKLPNTNSTVCQVTAASGAGANRASVVFTETAGNSTYTVQTAPCTVSNVTGTLNADGSQDLTWVNNADDPIPIWKRQNDGSWTLVLTVPAGQTSCHLSPSQ